MIRPKLTVRDDGSVEIDALAPWYVSVLLELPAILRRDDWTEAARGRLLPYPSDDAGERAEWERLVHPELFALLASAEEVIERDLAGLQPVETESPLGAWCLTIPERHVNAWVSGLNVARLALGSDHEITKSDMEDRWDAAETETEQPDPKRISITKIDLLAELQVMLIDHLNPPPPAEEEEPD